MSDIDTAISDKKIDQLIGFAQDKTLNIDELKKIYLAFKNNREIVGQVAMNLSLRTSVYEREKEYSDVMVELLCDIAINPVDMGARWAVAKNPHTPVQVLELLAKDEINLVRALVATNPSTPPNILEKLFSDEKIVRDGLSGNPSTPSKILKILASDSDKMVRMRLCENKNITKEILIALLDDEDEEVVKAAKINLEKQHG